MRKMPLHLGLILAAGTLSPAQPAAPEFQVNTYTSLSQFEPGIARLGTGDFVVVYTDSSLDGSGLGIFGRRFDGAGGPLDPVEFQVNSDTTGYQYDPAVAAVKGGGFVVVWASRGRIAGRLFDGDGTPRSAEFPVSEPTSNWMKAPSVAAQPDGGFVVAWEMYTPIFYGEVWTRVFDGSGSPRGTSFHPNTFTSDNQRSPEVATDRRGGFVVVWSNIEGDGSGHGIFGRAFDSAGGPESDEFLVNSTTLGAQIFPRIAMHPSGEFVVAWRSYDRDGSGGAVVGRRFHGDGAALGPDFQINQFTTSAQFPSGLQMDSAANFIVTWPSTGQDGDVSGVFARTYDVTSKPVSDEFQVNIFTTGRQSNARVAFDPSGSFVVAWDSGADEDGSRYGVFARPYPSPDGCGFFDLDADGLGDACDVVLLRPVTNETLDCTTPRELRPRFEWAGGRYDRFRVQVSWDPNFSRGSRITSGRRLLGRHSWKPGPKRWQRACRNAAPDLYVRVLGVDANVDRRNPLRRNLSNEVEAAAVRN